MKRETKDKVQYGSAVGMLLLGSCLAIAGFVQSSKGEIHDSVLWLFAQCLLYAGSIFGVSIYISERFTHIERKIQEKLTGKKE
ncbi:MAG: hypothetical protein KIC84_16005 [Dysgonomonas mossii]|uniref:hypothetical protein n=1 Tax=Dysgonomonas mossii TaxID=163665 RepID=UPI0026EE54A6|nr:hypothetical protein [Dysgonomonas mossii]MBS5908713.1 hypothetical protein [Dysgonomonas mossii]